MSAQARVKGSWDRTAWAMTCCKTGTGMGLTRDGGSSFLEKLENMRFKRKSKVPCGVSRGSGDPTLASVWPTLRTAPSTVRLRTGRWLGLMEPVR